MKESILNSIKVKFSELFGANKNTQESSELQSLRRVINELDHLPPEQAHYYAVYAQILYRVAFADTKITSDETAKIERVLKEWGHLTDEQVVLVAELARNQHRLFGGSENFSVSREFRDVATPEQKHDLLHSLFAVAAADDSINSAENDTIRMIAKEIGLSHEEFILVRQDFIDKLEALRMFPKSRQG